MKSSKLITLGQAICIDHFFGEIDAAVVLVSVIDDLGVYGHLSRIRSAESKRWLTVAGQKPISIARSNIVGMQHLGEVDAK